MYVDDDELKFRIDNIVTGSTVLESTCSASCNRRVLYALLNCCKVVLRYSLNSNLVLLTQAELIMKVRF